MMKAAFSPGTLVPSQPPAPPRGWFKPLNPPQSVWQGRAVWLVGASSGIGRATASALHAQGARVYVSARSQSALQAFVLTHPGAVALPLDSTDLQAVRAAARAILEQGPLDLVVYEANRFQSDQASRQVAIRPRTICKESATSTGFRSPPPVPLADPGAAGFALPGTASIARRLIEDWVAMPA